MPFVPMHKKWARYQGGATSSAGFLNGLTTNVGTVSRTVSTTLGAATTFTTTTADNNPAGMLNNTVSQIVRALYPSMEVTFAVSALTNTRVYIGFHNSGSSPTGEDWLNGTSKAGFLFCKRAADATWQIMTNNLTTGAAIITDTTVGIGSDAAVHTVKLVADDSGARFGYIIDGSAIAYVTNQVPATGTGIGSVIHIENVSGGVAKTLSMYDALFLSDK
jgi:hypothetical protein